MANSKNKGAGKRTKRDLKWFYLNDQLYRTQTVSRPHNTAICFNYDTQEWVTFLWSDIKRRAQRAYSTDEVCKMVNRARIVVERYINQGLIPPPKKSFPINRADWVFAPYRWSEKDIFRLHDLMLTKHMGRPRNDGVVIPQAMPTKAELRAMMRNESVTYVKDENDEFIPVWKENDW